MLERALKECSINKRLSAIRFMMSLIILILCLFYMGISCFLKANGKVVAITLIFTVVAMFLDIIWMICKGV